MLIDKSHRGWCIVATVSFLVSLSLYIAYAVQSPHGPTGGSRPGLAFGIAGSLLMIFVGLLGARKKFPWWRSLGSAQFWLRGHIWLGLLSVPMILFHSGFELGGLLEQILMLNFAVVVVSGIVGTLLQGYLPRMMRMALSTESMFEEIPSACLALRKTADDIVEKASGPLIQSPDPAVVSAAAAKPQRDDLAALRDFYLKTFRPFLVAHNAEIPTLTETSQQMARPGKAAARFEQLRNSLPADAHEVVNRLAGICEERRQLIEQQRMHHLLHGWLFIHVPISVALLVLGVLHAITALYY